MLLYRRCQRLVIGLGAVAALLLPLQSVADSSKGDGGESVFVSAARRDTWPHHLPVISHTVNEELFGIAMAASYGPEWQRRLPEPLIRFHRQRVVIACFIGAPY